MTPPVPGRIRPSDPLPVPRPGEFIWATGIEDTFVAHPHPATGRILDEYALTEHYARWEQDLALAAELGVQAVRYGIPWHRVNPAPGRFEWSWTDRVLERLVITHRIEPIIDLVHYGAPLWLERSFLHPDYPDVVSEYARAFAERYRDLCAWYTPLNEPRIHAWYCGKIGWWPPYGRGWTGYVRLLIALCRGICLTQRAVAEVLPNAVFVHVDASDLYEAEDPQDAAQAREAEMRQENVFLALDLVTGRVEASHPLYRWLEQLGAREEALVWFRRHSVQPHIVGFNMYPMFSRKRVLRAESGRPKVRIVPCWTETLAEIARQYARRYAPLPVVITETGSAGSVGRRVRWIQESAQTCRELRAQGVPLVGYTYWPMFSLVRWTYQRGGKPLDSYLLHMGLWDLVRRSSGLERVRTPAVDAYQAAIRDGGTDNEQTQRK